MSTLRTLRRVRRVLHRAEVYTGHAVAIGAGRAPQRLVNVVIGRTVGRLVRRVWR